MRFSSEGAPNDLLTLLRNGPEALVEAGKHLARAPEIDPAHITYLPVLPSPEKIICAGLNYADHSAESGFKQPDYPALFPRFASSLVGHKASIVRPLASDTHWTMRARSLQSSAGRSAHPGCHRVGPHRRLLLVQ